MVWLWFPKRGCWDVLIPVHMSMWDVDVGWTYAKASDMSHSSWCHLHLEPASLEKRILVGFQWEFTMVFFSNDPNDDTDSCFTCPCIKKAYSPVLSSLNIHRFIHTKRSLSDVTPTSPTLIASGLLASIYHCVNLFPFHIPPPPDSLACSLFCSSPLFPQSQQPPAWSCLLTTWSLGIQHTFSTPWLFDFFLFFNSHHKARTDASLTNSV